MSEKSKRPKRLIASTVADVNDGWIENVDDFIQDLARFYGYVVRKPGIPHGKHHKLQTYVIIGPKGIDAGGTMMGKRGHKAKIKRMRKYYEENEGGPPEVKFEFKVASWGTANIVYEVWHRFIKDIDKFIRELAAYYGYEIRRRRSRRREARKT